MQALLWSYTPFVRVYFIAAFLAPAVVDAQSARGAVTTIEVLAGPAVWSVSHGYAAQRFAPSVTARVSHTRASGYGVQVGVTETYRTSDVQSYPCVPKSGTKCGPLEASSSFHVPSLAALLPLGQRGWVGQLGAAWTFDGGDVESRNMGALVGVDWSRGEQGLQIVGGVTLLMFPGHVGGVKGMVLPRVGLRF